MARATVASLAQGFIQDFSKRGRGGGGGGGGHHLAPPTYQETVPITNVLTARIQILAAGTKGTPFACHGAGTSPAPTHC